MPRIAGLAVALSLQCAVAGAAFAGDRDDGADPNFQQRFESLVPESTRPEPPDEQRTYRPRKTWHGTSNGKAGSSGSTSTGSHDGRDGDGNTADR